MKPVNGGYAGVNGIKLYQEIYGQGEPLVFVCSYGVAATYRGCRDWS